MTDHIAHALAGTCFYILLSAKKMNTVDTGNSSLLYITCGNVIIMLPVSPGHAIMSSTTRVCMCGHRAGAGDGAA